jgi:putative ABC transport system permease protein
MFKNYFVIALRVLSKNKIYVALNITGLGFALACCILAYMNYDYRANFDSNYTDTENIYRLNSKKIVNGSVEEWGVAPLALGETLAKNNPGIKKIARLYSDTEVIKNKGVKFNERIYFADANFFEFFKFSVTAGNVAQFANINTVIVSEAFAKKLFKDEDALNQKITIIDRKGAEQIYTVAAVINKLPANSSFQFDIITSFDNYFSKAEQIDWRNNNQVTAFISVADGNSTHAIEKQAQAYTGIYNSTRTDEKLEGFKLEPFKHIALSSDRDFEAYVNNSTLNANPRGVIVIGPAIMSFLILLIACFNFTNISISFASNRLKEIGIRKVLGGARQQLIKQFLIENIILCTMAAILAILFDGVLLSTFNSLFSLNLKFNFGDPPFYIFLLILPLFTALISGIYPAFYISSFKPISILKGQTTFGRSNRFTRFLLFAQFSLSCFALIMGISLVKNASYQRKVDYGYAVNEMAVLQIDSASEYGILSAAIKSDPHITSIAGTVNQIGEGSPTLKVQVEGHEIQATVTTIGGEEYLKTAGVTLKEGRHFYAGKSPDQDAAVLVNETLLTFLNIKSPLGQRIKVDSAYYTIVGVVKDYKEMGLHGKVPPVVLKAAKPEDFKYLVARIPQNNLTSVYKTLQDKWHQALPAKPFSGFLQSEVIEKEVYMNEGFKSVAFFLAISTIALSASGIFALVSLNIIRRRKEIGMRKVLGASTASIVTLINKEFIRMMLVSFAIGSALGFLLIDNFVFGIVYAYHPKIGVVPFALTLLIILITSAITVGSKVYRAATANPIKALGAE